MSAEAGRTGADNRIEDKASAAENAFNEDELSSVELETGVWFEEHTMVEVLGFVVNWDPNLDVEMGFERFVGIVRDMVFSFLFLMYYYYFSRKNGRRRLKCGEWKYGFFRICGRKERG